MQRLFGLLWFLCQLAILVSFIIFAASNYERVPLRFWPFKGEIYLAPWTILLAGTLFGFFLAALVSGWLRLKGFTTRRKVERRSKALESRVADLSEEAGSLRTQAKQDTVREATGALEAPAPQPPKREKNAPQRRTLSPPEAVPTAAEVRRKPALPEERNKETGMPDQGIHLEEFDNAR